MCCKYVTRQVLKLPLCYEMYVARLYSKSGKTEDYESSVFGRVRGEGGVGWLVLVKWFCLYLCHLLEIA